MHGWKEVQRRYTRTEVVDEIEYKICKTTPGVVFLLACQRPESTAHGGESATNIAISI